MNNQRINTNIEYLLAVNAGSSSIKLAVFSVSPLEKTLEATVTNIGQPSAHLVTTDSSQPLEANNHAEAAKSLIRWLTTKIPTTAVIATGHRVVHGGPHYHTTQAVTDRLLSELQELTAFDPQHLPTELQLIELFGNLLPKTRQVVCFDTAFHHNLPTRSRILPIPRKFEEMGIRRYGFHGLSYASILEELGKVEGETAANGKVIVAHLGSGVSLAALHNSKPIDTTMSMTPTSGVPMSTRSGDLDPGLALYLKNTQGYSTEQFNHIVNFESGLLGISEITPDMEQLLALESVDTRAKDAIDVFCYNIKKSIGGLAAALGGLNTLVFTGGMGENASQIRARICEGLEFLGIILDTERNSVDERLISTANSPTGVHVIHTDEAITIARETANYINNE